MTVFLRFQFKRWAVVALPALLLISIAIATFPQVSGYHAQDLALYRDSGMRLLQGAVPYRDFPFEYPPLALVPFTFAAIFVKPSAQIGSFALVFLLENAAICSVIALIVALQARRSAERSALSAVLLLATLAAIGAPLFPWRYDLFPTMLTAAALLAAVSRRPATAGVMIGLGICAKLYPLVLVPIFGAYYLSMNERRAFARFGASAAIATTVPLIPFLMLAPHDLLSFVRYHELRGLEIESVGAGVLMFIHLFGGPVVAAGQSFGAIHVQSPLAAPILLALPVVFLASIALVTALAWTRFRAEIRMAGAISGDTLLRYAVAALLTFVVTNKVFSPQYVTWFLPFFPLLFVPSCRTRYAHHCAHDRDLSVSFSRARALGGVSGYSLESPQCTYARAPLMAADRSRITQDGDAAASIAI